MSNDRIERSILLKARRSRVWQALSSPAEFGAWFGAALSGPAFAPGQSVRGPITYPGLEHVQLEMQIERVEPERVMAYRWHPYAVEPDVDYSNEPTTLVEFTLDDEDGGTRLIVVESGFDRIPTARRDEAYRMNSSGWEEQARNVTAHIDGPV